MSQKIWADFRSDACTEPTSEMRQAMAHAEVGNDDFGEDPTIQRLEREVAGLLGKPAALFVQSGTMGNLAALMSIMNRGDGILTSPNFHISYWEGDAVRRVVGGGFLHCRDSTTGPYTSIDLPHCNEIQDLLRQASDNSVVCPVLSIESPVNRHGGSLIDWSHLREISEWAGCKGLHLHLDGARFFNAVVGLGKTPAELASIADSITVSFNKGVGAPAGAAVVGTADLVDRARHFRWMLGGAWKQGGIFAAGCLHGLSTVERRVAEDHRRAKYLARELNSIPGLATDVDATITNTVMLRVVDPSIDLDSIQSCLLGECFRIGRFKEGRVARLMTHSGVTDELLDRFLLMLKQVVSRAMAR